MNLNLLKPILVGLLLGSIAFFALFLLFKLLIIAALAGLVFRLFIGHRFFRGRHMMHRLAFVDNIRKMSEEEYQKFKNNMQSNPWKHRGFGRNHSKPE